MDDCTDPTGAKVDTIYTVIALRYLVCRLSADKPKSSNLFMDFFLSIIS
jgi:hypothetical protein